MTTVLAALIGRHKAGRTPAELAEASGGVISASQWEHLERAPLRGEPPLDPATVEALATALGLTKGTVWHYALASRALPVGRQH
jgi:hypothetical protein